MSEMNVREDEINLYDYWKVIVKRKRLIIGIFLVVVLASAIISFLMPKIYRGEVVLKLPLASKELTSKELLSVIGKIAAEKVKNILPTTHHLIADVKLNALKDSIDKLQLIIEAKNKDDISSAITELVAYLNNFSLINRAVEEERQKLIMQSEEINKVIKGSDELTRTYKKLLESGRLIPVGFNPIELEKRASDLKIEKLIIEQGIKRPKGVEMISLLNIPKNPVKPSIKKNIAVAGFVSLFAGIFWAFFIEYVEKVKLQSKND